MRAATPCPAEPRLLNVTLDRARRSEAKEKAAMSAHSTVKLGDDVRSEAEADVVVKLRSS
jgi:hypothetical protein